MTDRETSKSLVRTVDHLKNTTTNMRGFADSVDHLLNALEEFYPFIDTFLSSTKELRGTIPKTLLPRANTNRPHQMYRRR